MGAVGAARIQQIHPCTDGQQWSVSSCKFTIASKRSYFAFICALGIILMGSMIAGIKTGTNTLCLGVGSGGRGPITGPMTASTVSCPPVPSCPPTTRLSAPLEKAVRRGYGWHIAKIGRRLESRGEEEGVVTWKQGGDGGQGRIHFLYRKCRTWQWTGVVWHHVITSCVFCFRRRRRHCAV